MNPKNSSFQSYELEVAPGLESIAQEEIQSVLGKLSQIKYLYKGCIQIDFGGSLDQLKQLKTVSAVYRLLTFTIPRPKALLGHEFLKQIIAEIHTLRKNGIFNSLSISAAGQESAIMMRIRSELCQATKLEPIDELGDLRVRIRPTLSQNNAWDVLLRITPRPLATRAWRKENLEGALNAPVAHAMLRLLKLEKGSRLLNIGCGSGTFLAEAAPDYSENLMGCDISAENLDLTKINISTVKNHKAITLIQADVAKLPFFQHSVDAICSDLPFGQLIGSQTQVQRLYPIWLQESARILKRGQKFVLITHAIRLIEQTIQDQEHLWIMDSVYPINLNGLHPRIYLLKRN